MNAASLICEIIAQGGKVSSAFYDGNQAFATIKRHGYLREDGVVESVVCEECEESHAAAVIFQGKQYGHHCPELGFTPLKSAAVKAFAPNIPLLISQLADTFECRQRKCSEIHSRTWRIGAMLTLSEPVMLYFHPRLRTEDDARDLQSALSREPRSQWTLVVTSQGALPIPETTTARLDDLVEMDLDTGVFCAIADAQTLAGIPRTNPGGRPNAHGALLTQIIENRIKNGTALPGRNEEADAILKKLAQQNLGAKIPSRSSVRSYVTKVRAGQ